MNECEIIANEIMQKLHSVSNKNDIPVDVLLNAGINLFLRNNHI